MQGNIVMLHGDEENPDQGLHDHLDWMKTEPQKFIMLSQTDNGRVSMYSNIAHPGKLLVMVNFLSKVANYIVESYGTAILMEEGEEEDDE